MHLALTGLHAIDLDMAQRLFVADWAMENGVTAEQLYKFAGILRKDDTDDEDEDEDEDESDGDDTGFNPAAHPRWPAGSPGGIGGEFAPKDADTGIASSPRGGATGSWDYGATGSWDVKPPDEGRVDESYGLDAVIGIVGAIGMEAIGLLGERAAITGTTGIAEVTPSSVEVPAPLPKPEGIPDDWIEKPSRDGTGKIYSNPDNPNDVVRVMPGNPNSPNPWQQKPYVIDQDGGFQDVNGNPIPGNAPGKTQDAHIPYKNFRFKRQLMPTDINIWKKRIKEAVDGIADEALQRRSWFGYGPEVFSPEEMFCQFFDDVSIENFLKRTDTGLNPQQIKTGNNLVGMMNQLADKTYVSAINRFADPAKLIDDPLMKKCRMAAKAFLSILN